MILTFKGQVCNPKCKFKLCKNDMFSFKNTASAGYIRMLLET